MEKIQLSIDETINLTRIKLKDIQKMIEDANYICDEFYYDEQIAYLPRIKTTSKTNPIRDIIKLQESMDFVMEKFYTGQWETTIPPEEKITLLSLLKSVKENLDNAMLNAIKNSQFKDKYKAWDDSYSDYMYRQPFSFSKLHDQFERSTKERAGWVPSYERGKLVYNYFIDYHGKRVSLDNVERADYKEILAPELIKTEIIRGY